MPARNNLIPCSVLVAALAVSVGCASRKVPVSTPVPSIRHGYVDLQAGWRIRFVAPALKHRQHTFHLQTVEHHGHVIALRAPKDFIGYEVALYSVKARRGGGVTIRFKSAEIRSARKVTKRDRPPVQLFHLPARMRYVRLVFLTKVSARDHKQGILAATSMRRLNALTRSVETSPNEGCKRYAEALCSWIPRGMTAQPEKRDPEHHKRWVPVL